MEHLATRAQLFNEARTIYHCDYCSQAIVVIAINSNHEVE